MKITAIAAVTAVAVAAIAIPCCEATDCDNKGPFEGRDEETVTANLPYGTVCEALWSEDTAWLECKDASEDAFAKCRDRVTGMTKAQYNFHMDNVLRCDPTTRDCLDACITQDEKCVTNEIYDEIKQYWDNLNYCGEKLSNENYNDLSSEEFYKKYDECMYEAAELMQTQHKNNI